MTDERQAQLRYGALRSGVRRHMLEILGAAPEPLDAAELGAQLELHVTTARFHLGQLEAAGLVVRQPVAGPGPGRPRVVYRAAASAPEPNGPVAVRELVGVLAAALAEDADGGAARAERAGRAWASSRAATAGEDAASALTRSLTDLGFEPEVERRAEREVSDDAAIAGGAPRPAESPVRRIALNACPVRELARDHRSVICAAHAGLIAGIVEPLGVARAEVELRPFVEPRLCEVLLSGRRTRPTQPTRTA